VIRRAILTIVALLCLTSVGVAQTLTFPPLTGRVVDEAGLLSPGDRATLTASLADLEAKTTDQLVVVTLKSLHGTAIEDYGYQLGRNWRIGQKDKDSGVLLIVAATERQVRIEVGYGLEGTLTDAATKLIIENAILPAFKTGDFAGGIKTGVDQITQLLRGDAGNAPVAHVGPAPAASTSSQYQQEYTSLVGHRARSRRSWTSDLLHRHRGSGLSGDHAGFVHPRALRQGRVFARQVVIVFRRRRLLRWRRKLRKLVRGVR
jgi:uncharacterized membrane protein YgcG